MKITKKEHKSLLASCLFQNGVAKEAPDAMRSDIKSLFEKIARIQDGQVVCFDGEVELTPGEIVAAKMFYDQKKDWPWNVSEELMQELKDIFYPPKPNENVT